MNEDDLNLQSLSDGIPHMPRSLTGRERVADHLFFYLQMASRWLFLVGGIVGFAAWSWLGCIALAVGCLLFGSCIRHSLGVRGPDSFHGFYRRMRERASGSRPGLLERVLEGLRRNSFTPAKCKDLVVAYDIAMSGLKNASSSQERQQVLRDLDIETKRISYSE